MSGDGAHNLAQYAIGRAAAARGDAIALLVFSHADEAASETWTFAEIEDAVLRGAAALADMGLARGDRVLVRLDNTSAYALLYFAAIAGGFVPVPVSSQLTGEEAAFIAADSGAALIARAAHLPLDDVPTGCRVIGEDEVAALFAHSRRASYADTRAEDAAYLVYTSGTTARPKGVLHAQRAGLGRSPMYAGWYGLSCADRMLHAGAFNWTFTLGTGLTDPWANGATAIVYTGVKEPALWPRLIRRTGATMFAAVPGVFRQILKHTDVSPGTLGALRHGLVAGEAPPDALFDDWERRTGTPLYEALGMSEISTYVSCSPTVQRRAGFVGKPQPGRRVAILPVEAGETPLAAGEEGLLAVHRSDPAMMLGYWNRADEEAAVFRGDWFVGGDLAVMDADGYVAHRGRADDVVKALGYRVSPQEVEAVLARHPAVAEVACAAVAVAEGISVVGAFVVAQPGAAQDADAIRAFAREHLAAYKAPRVVHFVAALPRTPNGKIKRRALMA